ncbi:RNA polymerase sigma factor [Moheibacter sp.]|uniref:RNA polymerase sigma factor n=1 Tax=Moheibacter sp. TaxID=1965316 RepID=UPI003C78D8E4
MTEDEVKRYLKSNQEKALFKIYDFYKSEFLQFANRYELPKDDILDVYQDAFIALHENALKGKLDELKSNVKTYFFAIGKYMIYSKLKQDKKSIYMESADDFQFDESWSIEEEPEENSSVRKLEIALNQMGGKCKELLTYFYYEEKKLDEIVLLMNYDNKDVAKSQKSRCMKNLKNLLNKNQ